MPETRRISAIKIGKRHRQDLGDLQSLADSIEAVGLLHPIVIDSQDRLIAGERRLEAVRLLRWKTVPVHVIDLENIAEGEFHENAARKDFTPSEVAGIARVLRPVIEARARQRQLDNLRKGRKVPVSENFANLGCAVPKNFIEFSRVLRRSLYVFPGKSRSGKATQAM